MNPTCATCGVELAIDASEEVGRWVCVNCSTSPPSTVDHPDHYGGADNPYEAIKVIEAWDLNFNLGNAVKYIARAGHKVDRLEDLKKAIWYLQREVQ